VSEDFQMSARVFRRGLTGMCCVMLCLGLVLCLWRPDAQRAEIAYAAAGSDLVQVRASGCGTQQAQIWLTPASNKTISALRSDPYQARYWLRLALIEFCQNGAHDSHGYEALNLAKGLSPTYQSLSPHDLLRALQPPPQ
jgi:hypothetical protein